MMFDVCHVNHNLPQPQLPQPLPIPSFHLHLKRAVCLQASCLVGQLSNFGQLTIHLLTRLGLSSECLQKHGNHLPVNSTVEWLNGYCKTTSLF